MSRAFGPRRSTWIEVAEPDPGILDGQALEQLTFLDLIYRSLCAILFNFAQSGHPGGSVSSGRIVEGLLFNCMDYSIGAPNRRDADILSYAAGHKALGLYAMYALRDEMIRITDPSALPGTANLRLRFEDLLGFRRNPATGTPLFKRFGVKALDGHPTPATPFVKLSTGASGVGMGSSLGLAVAAADYYGKDAPRVHIVEGEGGLTPGRAYEALAFAGTAGLHNAVVHLDWNQASIDSEAVTREGTHRGDYVQWDPMELFYLHDWNVLAVPDGFDFALVATAQRRALTIDNGQPTVIVYRTTKGWRYGMEGKKSHGAGHKLCSPEYRGALEPLLGPGDPGLPGCDGASCGDDQAEDCHWKTLEMIRGILERNRPICEAFTHRVMTAASRLDARNRLPREGAPDVERIYAGLDPNVTPAGLELAPGGSVALREQLGRALGHLNRSSGGAMLIGAADLLESTAISEAARDFPKGFFHVTDNPGSRSLSVGGICEDGLSCVLSGVSAFGHHVGAFASYGAFSAPLSHIASRLHAIGNQVRHHVEPGPYRPFVVICGHVGMKTGEDGPTHADPQSLQLLQENFVPGTMITLTPWDPQEVWPLVAEAFKARPAVIAPFVTRPREPILDRAALGLTPASAAVAGVYRLRPSPGPERDGTIVLQSSAVTYAFVQEALPLLDAEGVRLEIFYVASAELFNRLSSEDRERLLPDSLTGEAMGITGFTLATMYRWIRSDLGLAHTLHPFQKGHFLGSGPGPMVVLEAGLDGESQHRAVMTYVESLARRRRSTGS
jgi:transketolase